MYTYVTCDTNVVPYPTPSANWKFQRESAGKVNIIMEHATDKARLHWNMPLGINWEMPLIIHNDL